MQEAQGAACLCALAGHKPKPPMRSGKWARRSVLGGRSNGASPPGQQCRQASQDRFVVRRRVSLRCARRHNAQQIVAPWRRTEQEQQPRVLEVLYGRQPREEKRRRTHQLLLMGVPSTTSPCSSVQLPVQQRGPPIEAGQGSYQAPRPGGSSRLQDVTL